MGPRQYAATVGEGQEVTHHRITVSEQVLADLQLPDVDERHLVEETIGYLLEREPGTSLPHDIDTDQIYRDDDQYLTELRDRLLGRT
ncbi:hypothetical protein LX15_005572 [Streptoalloteichus tenebrarius]|uniref:Uncharacterized protein n=2 Tax=Streptoalloteichus tenebrarius (strain ATCC 17920 / DSM 40477 / JCM 4838 / CBS 697.72 / NBRC 16177 / NCIMB 11028 / NRRL B-12390 / A12253. 1 / ISP 5477) TaxID=1933 RepID=A0ABT1I2Q1_STRSD|nr:hypothetical protein [Streptoalloteichus tenebrarius]